MHITVQRQTDYVTASYAPPFRVVGLPDDHPSRLSSYADKVLRELTGRGLFQHGFGEGYSDDRHAWLLHASGFRFALHVSRETARRIARDAHIRACDRYEMAQDTGLSHQEMGRLRDQCERAYERLARLG